jgi:hypothetical protein
MLVLIRAEGSLRSAFGGVELDLGPVAPSRGLGEICRETCDSLCIGFGYVPNDYCLGIFIFISFAAGHFWPEASANKRLGKKRERAPRMSRLCFPSLSYLDDGKFSNKSSESLRVERCVSGQPTSDGYRPVGRLGIDTPRMAGTAGPRPTPTIDITISLSASSTPSPVQL